jgi:phosphonatase-like hydrolase
MKRIELVIFDMAGTTVRDTGQVGACFVNAFREQSILVPPAEVNKVMGFRKKDAIRMLLNQLPVVVAQDTETLIEAIHASFTRSMINFYEQGPGLEPLAGAEAMFDWLKERKIRTALNTGFTKVITDTILKRLNWTAPGTVDAVISSDEVPHGRPHPYMVRRLQKTLGIDNALNVAKVGDTEVDIQEGRNAGCGLVISVTSGAYSRQALQKFSPDHIIDSLAELPALIQ